MNLTNEEKSSLLKLSRDTIHLYINEKKTPDISKYKLTEKLKEKRGVFVTLKVGEELRGCIGYVEGIMPIYKAVIDNTINASTRDPRFEPVSENELDGISIEISVMSPLKKINSIDEIEVGKHGLIMRRGCYSGLLLPQVATEWGWDKKQFLDATANKAGLPKDAWKDSQTEIYIFSAEVFGEKD